MLLQINSTNPSFGQVTCIKVPYKALGNYEPRTLIEKVTKKINNVAPDLKTGVLLERHNYASYYCPNITNIPMTMAEGAVNICVVTGKEYDALVNKDSTEFAEEVKKEFQEKYGVAALNQDSELPLTEAGEEISAHDAISSIITSKFSALLNLEGKEVPVIKIDNLDGINEEVVNKLR